ncbi:hypothetical protein AB0E83_18010 [Streptomyces sp. NPDC035033]|uniref:hypothetical protein n=1 Tax=Streptomyces sp. NPDC035033 TaxID=3155368 RepID=UPI003407F226
MSRGTRGRGRGTVVPVLALAAVAVVTGCASSEGEDEGRSTELRRRYCLEVGRWQEALRAEGARTPGSPAYEEVGSAVRAVFLATRPLRDEGVTGGHSLGEETLWAVEDRNDEALSLVMRYCADAGFETLTG